MPIDPNTGMWYEAITHSPGPGGSGGLGGALQAMNEWQSGANRDEVVGDRLYQRYLNMYKNPQATEGFQDTDQGQHAISQMHMDPDTASSAVTSSPWYHERDFLQNYDPAKDEDMSGLWRGIMQSGDTATAKGMLPAMRDIRKQKAMEDRQDSKDYDKQLDDASKTISATFLKLVSGGMPPDRAITVAQHYTPGFATLDDEDKEKIISEAKQLVDPQTGQMLPGAQALIGARNARATKDKASAALDYAKIGLTNAQIGYLKQKGSLADLTGILRKRQTEALDETDDAKLMGIAERATADAAKYKDVDPSRAKALTQLADKVTEWAGSDEDEGEEQPAAGAKEPAVVPAAKPATKPAASPAASRTTIVNSYKSAAEVKAAYASGAFGTPGSPTAKAKAKQVLQENFPDLQ